MSTKASVIYTKENDNHIYYDCVNQFDSDNKPVSEITFELDLRDIRIDSIDKEHLVFSIDKDSEIFREFHKMLKDKSC